MWKVSESGDDSIIVSRIDSRSSICKLFIVNKNVFVKELYFSIN